MQFASLPLDVSVALSVVSHEESFPKCQCWPQLHVNGPELDDPIKLNGIFVQNHLLRL